MKPTGFVEVKSDYALPRLQRMYDYVELERFREFAYKVNRLIGKKTSFFGKKRSAQEAWNYLISDDYGYLLEPNDQLDEIKGLIEACKISETVLINTDKLQTVLYG